jgi:SAM-dependent methyltransferase
VVRAVYRRQARFFRRAYETGVHGWPVEGPTPELRDYLRRIPPGRALDLGCGEGRHAILMAKMGFRVEAVDLEPLALAKAQAFARRAGVRGRIRFSRGDALGLRFPAASFDVLLDSGCFHHVTKADWPRYVAGVARVLRPGGALLLTVFSTKFRHFPGERRTRPWLYHRNHYDRFFRRGQIAPIFAPAFALEEIREEHHGLAGFWHCRLRRV